MQRTRLGRDCRQDLTIQLPGLCQPALLMQDNPACCRLAMAADDGVGSGRPP